MAILDSHKGMKLDAKAALDTAEAIRCGYRDEFGVKILNVFYNEQGQGFCLTDAPNVEAVRQSHEKKGLACEDIVAIDCVGGCASPQYLASCLCC